MVYGKHGIMTMAYDKNVYDYMIWQTCYGNYDYGIWQKWIMTMLYGKHVMATMANQIIIDVLKRADNPMFYIF